MGSFILQGSGTMQPHGANGTCLRQLQVPKMDPARFVWAPTSITATPRTVAAQSDNCAVFIPSREGLACISGVNSDTFVVQRRLKQTPGTPGAMAACQHQAELLNSSTLCSSLRSIATARSSCIQVA